MEEKQISKAVITRLPRYYRALTMLKNQGVTRISSEILGEKMKLTPSQIRQDLNQFGCFGQQGYGYNVAFLLASISKVIGLDKKHQMIVCGAGNIGKALSNYPGFVNQGFQINAIFDNSLTSIGSTLNQIPIFDIQTLESYTNEHPVDIAVLAVPRHVAFDIAQRLFKSQVKGVWNFSNTELHPPAEISVVDVHLMDSLMTLAYEINGKKK